MTTECAGHPAGVQDIQTIRRANLNFLLQEVAAELGTERGAAADLARRTLVPAPFISQFLRQQLHQGHGERAMGDKTARKLERGMSKPKGWMDVDRTLAEDFREAAILDGLRLLTPAQRATIGQLVKEFGQANKPDTEESR
jgi:hypothetical protein